jgi:hypothetical protein
MHSLLVVTDFVCSRPYKVAALLQGPMGVGPYQAQSLPPPEDAEDAEDVPRGGRGASGGTTSTKEESAVVAGEPAARGVPTALI